MVERSRDLTTREGGVTERQRQLDARSTRLATEAARVTAERLALQEETAEFEAKRAAFAATCTTKSFARRLATEDAEPTWHSVADGEHSQDEWSDVSDDGGSQVP